MLLLGARAFAFGLLLLGWASIAAADPLAEVDPQFPGGLTFRGAASPFGMIQWGSCAQGYSLTFLSGAEMPVGYDKDLPILPVARAVDSSMFASWAGAPKKPASEDQARPGYLRSRLDDGTVAEMTTSARTGMGRFAFPRVPRASVLLYLDHGDNAATIVPGTREVRGWLTRQGRRIWFVAQFDRAFAEYGTWQSKIINWGEKGDAGISGAFVTFDASGGNPVQMKVALSYVSPEGAEANLMTENAGWDFAAMQAQAEAQWREALSSIEIEGGTAAERRLFYTSLYHALLHPNVFNDVNGQYLGFDDKIHRSERPQYANYSGWDIYRSWMPLIAWLFPKRASDMMQSLVNDEREGGGAMPRWPVANRETGVMNDGSATPIVAGAYAFGARDFDLAEALAAMDRAEGRPGTRCQSTVERPELAEYLEVGYAPQGALPLGALESASMTLEFASGEFALSRFAAALGDSEKASRYEKLSRNWRNLWDPRSGYIRPRYYDGSWLDDEDFDPGRGHFWGFTEGTAAQYTWMVPHALRELFDLMGGNEAAARRLDGFFTKLNDGMDSRYSWIGNEPGFLTPWEYNWAGAPWKTQAVLARMIDEVFVHLVPGDDDLGATGSWAIWTMLGLYPAIPGVGGLTVATPRFPQALVHLGDGRELRVVARGEGPYLQGVWVDGRELRTPWLELSALKGPHPTILVTRGTEPNRAWGASPETAPPSF